VHELSVALTLLDEVGTAAARERATGVSSVRLRIGRMSGIARDALVFAWEIARADTIAAQAELHIEDVGVTVFCPRCEGERASVEGGGLVCGTCGTTAASIVHGRELELVSMEVVS